MWAAIIAAIGAIVSVIIQSSQNKKIAEYQADRNEQYLQEQNEYNTPANQMDRFSAAGLNPALIYGQGSPGNQSAPLSFPDIKPADFQGAGAAVGGSIIQGLQTKLMQAQIRNVESKTIESQAKSGLIDVQRRIAESNPYLNKVAYEAMIQSFVSSAQIKGSEASLIGQKESFMKGTLKGDPSGQWKYQTDRDPEAGYIVMQRQLQLLDQKFKLGEADQKIKGEILESKEFQNQILEVQKNFMTDGDVTPQHMITFLQLLLMRLAK